jgi:hypothetical protein
MLWPASSFAQHSVTVWVNSYEMPRHTLRFTAPAEKTLVQVFHPQNYRTRQTRLHYKTVLPTGKAFFRYQLYCLATVYFSRLAFLPTGRMARCPKGQKIWTVRSPLELTG